MKKIITTEDAPTAIGPYSQAVFAGDTLYVSGQLPIDPATGKMPETVEEQTEQCLKNVFAILQAAGYGSGNVVKSTVLLADMADFAAMNAVYARFYGGDGATGSPASFPARVCYAVAALPMGARVEIETIAVK